MCYEQIMITVLTSIFGYNY